MEKSGLKPSRWKAECVERRPLRLEGGKDCKVLPILTEAARPSLPHKHEEVSYEVSATIVRESPPYHLPKTALPMETRRSP